MCLGLLFLVNATLAMLARIHRLALHHALIAILGQPQPMGLLFVTPAQQERIRLLCRHRALSVV